MNLTTLKYEMPQFPVDPVELFLRLKRSAPTAKAQPKRMRKSRSKVEPRMLSTEQAAEFLGISEWKLRQLAHNGDISVVKGKYWHFDIHDLEAYIEHEKERL